MKGSLRKVVADEHAQQKKETTKSDSFGENDVAVWQGRSCNNIGYFNLGMAVSTWGWPFQPGDGHFNLGIAIFEAQKWLFSEE